MFYYTSTFPLSQSIASSFSSRVSQVSIIKEQWNNKHWIQNMWPGSLNYCSSILSLSQSLNLLISQLCENAKFACAHTNHQSLRRTFFILSNVCKTLTQATHRICYVQAWIPTFVTVKQSATVSLTIFCYKWIENITWDRLYIVEIPHFNSFSTACRHGRSQSSCLCHYWSHCQQISLMYYRIKD